MGTKMRDLLGGALSSLRYEPTEKRLRAYLGQAPVADTVDGLLIWEPGRVVPTYAMPERDVCVQLESAGRVDDLACPGETFDVIVGAARCTAAAFRPDDPDLTGYLMFNFGAFEWREEDEPIVAHPHDPFKRIDILTSSRHVRIEWEGRLLAETSRPLLLFETLLPVRFYLRRDDVVDLEPSDTVSYCAYKGRASYFSVPDGPADVAWTYHQPLREAHPLAGRIAFFDERLDVTLDGERRARPVTQWSG